MTMRGEDSDQNSVFSYVPLVKRIPKNHPLRPMRAMVDTALSALLAASGGARSPARRGRRRVMVTRRL